jgi:hypothetical protein
MKFYAECKKNCDFKKKRGFCTSRRSINICRGTPTTANKLYPVLVDTDALSPPAGKKGCYHARGSVPEHAHVLRIAPCGRANAEPICALVKLTVDPATKDVKGWAEVSPAQGQDADFVNFVGAALRKVIKDIRFKVSGSLMKKEEEELGESAGRRAGGMRATSFYSVSAGSNTAGNDEALVDTLGDSEQIGVGRRGGGGAASKSFFSLSAGSNTAGNDEALTV